jgi:hypothetical protein
MTNEATVRAAYTFVESMVDRCDGYGQSAPMWHGWALREAYIVGHQAALSAACPEGHVIVPREGAAAGEETYIDRLSRIYTKPDVDEGRVNLSRNHRAAPAEDEETRQLRETAARIFSHSAEQVRSVVDRLAGRAGAAAGKGECGRCEGKGKGRLPTGEEYDCAACKGTGQRPVEPGWHNNPDCPTCNGTGRASPAAGEVEDDVWSVPAEEAAQHVMDTLAAVRTQKFPNSPYHAFTRLQFSAERLAKLVLRAAPTPETDKAKEALRPSGMNWDQLHQIGTALAARDAEIERAAIERCACYIETRDWWADKETRTKAAAGIRALTSPAEQEGEMAMNEREIAGVRRAVTWLHERAAEMNDPHAQQVLNSAATNLGWALRRWQNGTAIPPPAQPEAHDDE